MRRISLLPNIITSFGLACGLFVIFKVNMTGMGTFDLLYTMTLILLFAAVADVLDGAIARAIKAESEFGILFDSLSDAISFGVAPSVLFLKSLSLDADDPLAIVSLAGAMIFTICGVYRLVRYNVKYAKVEPSDEVAKKNFIGLPIPAAAVGAVAPNLLLNSPLVAKYINVSLEFKTIFLSAVMIVMGYLMVSRIRFPSLKALHFRMPQFHYVFMASVLTVLILYGLLYYLSALLIAFSWGYIALALVLTVVRFFRNRKAKRLGRSDSHEE